jgi:hypothetical protein
MKVIRQREMLVLHGLDVLKWRDSLPSKYWNNRILNGIRLFLKQPSASDVGQPVRPEHPWDRRVRDILSYYKGNRQRLENIVRANDDWSDRYPGATALNLALQFVDTIMATVEGLDANEFEPFVHTLVPILNIGSTHDSDTRKAIDTTVLQTVELMIQFVVATSDRQKRNPSNTNKDGIDVLDDFNDDLFALLSSNKLEHGTNLTVWNLLQVLHLPHTTYRSPPRNDILLDASTTSIPSRMYITH